MIRIISVLIFAVVVFSSCKFNPTELANDYCNCIKKKEQGKVSENECIEMAESHYLKLQDEEEALNKYTQFIGECMQYDDIRTNEDLREDRKERRSRQK